MARSKVLWFVVVLMVSATAMVWAEEKEAGGNEAEEKDKVAVGATADFFSKYIWPGRTSSITGSCRPGASVGYQGLPA